jgi:hypothetical protein
MLLGLQGKGIAVYTWVGVAGVVVEWLGDVEVLAGLLGETILAIKDELEGVEGTDLNCRKRLGSIDKACSTTILSPEDVGI